MNLGENICNAFDIVAKTYENVNKLMSYCRTAVNEKGEYELVTPRFLRYKSDIDISGWHISSFVLLFQNVNDPLLKNKWRNGPVYVMEINLYQPTVCNIPIVNVAKFEYVGIESWAEGCSIAYHWIFRDPLYGDNVEYEYKDGQEGEMYFGNVSDTGDADKRLWGLRKITGFEIPLTEITSDNAYEKVFGNFRVLADK
jgi:hypothetical protein